MTVDVHLTPADLRAALEADVRVGLTASPKWLKPIYFYDDEGSRLFDEITRLPEYYPTRTEAAILTAHAKDIAAAAGAATLVELGSGTSEKTQILLDALEADGRLRRFVALDVSEQTLLDAVDATAKARPDLEVDAIVGDFTRHLGTIPGGGPTLVAFLGGTIGNLVPEERERFFADLADALQPGDHLLLGTDLVKDRGRLVAAYDDAQGVTAAFNKNVLSVLNATLHADFDVDAFDHVARFDEDGQWIEMRLRARTAQTVRIADLDLSIGFAAGEDVRTEISAKFLPVEVADELAAARLWAVATWTDPDGDYLLTLARR